MVDGVSPEHEVVHMVRGVVVDNCLKTDCVVLPFVVIGIVRAKNKAI